MSDLRLDDYGDLELVALTQEVERAICKRLSDFVGLPLTQDTRSQMEVAIMNTVASKVFDIDGFFYSINGVPLVPCEEIEVDVFTEPAELSERGEEILKVLHDELKHLNCDCGGLKAKTPHADWCSSGVK